MRFCARCGAEQPGEHAPECGWANAAEHAKHLAPTTERKNVRHPDSTLRAILRPAARTVQERGDHGRLHTGTPARNIGHGMGLGVCCMDNCLMVGLFTPGPEADLPYPSDEEVALCGQMLTELIDA
tara:strand:+ start:1727 stop:2104 length:378 start_codon:yes stop_codon:yes gene_type:complete